MSAPSTELGDRVDALRTAIHEGVDLLPHDALQDAANVVRRADARLRHGTEFTVVALAGATGSGKSSIFNALVGEEVSPVGVMRPTTEHVRAAVFGARAPDGLLNWLEVRHRHAVAPHDLDGLVLLDLPDHDSIVTNHRLEVDRLVDLVDVIVWVLDPQKYADEALHVRYLAPLAQHGESMAFVLNQADLVAEHERQRWAEHAGAVLAADGIGAPDVRITSTITGEGMADLRAMLRIRIESREAALARLDADLRRCTNSLGSIPRPDAASKAATRQLSRNLSEAAGAGVVADAVAAGYRFDATKATGWPFARWLLRFRRHPLRALRPTAPAASPAAPQRPTAIPIDHPRLDLAIRKYADSRLADEDARWARRARTAAAARVDELPAALGTSVRAIAQAAISPPRWWRWVGGLQRLLAGVAIAGAVWLVLLAVLEYLKVPTDDITPHVGDWPVPTLLLLGGGAAGLLVALLARLIAGAGARRRARKAKSTLAISVDEISGRYVIAPIDAEFGRWTELADHLALAGGSGTR